MFSRTLIDMVKMKDDKTCMAFNISFIPETANKYFLAACDEYVRLYDFEQAMVSPKQISSPPPKKKKKP